MYILQHNKRNSKVLRANEGFKVRIFETIETRITSLETLFGTGLQQNSYRNPS